MYVLAYTRAWLFRQCWSIVFACQSVALCTYRTGMSLCMCDYTCMSVAGSLRGCARKGREEEWKSKGYRSNYGGSGCVADWPAAKGAGAGQQDHHMSILLLLAAASRFWYTRLWSYLVWVFAVCHVYTGIHSEGLCVGVCVHGCVSVCVHVCVSVCTVSVCVLCSCVCEHACMHVWLRVWLWILPCCICAVVV